MLDAETATDIPGAQASIGTMDARHNWFTFDGYNWTNFCQPMLVSLNEEDEEDEPSAPGLARNGDDTFAVPRRLVLGAVRPFGLIGPLGWALENTPTVYYSVSAPGYHQAQLSYAINRRPDVGFSSIGHLLPQRSHVGVMTGGAWTLVQEVDGELRTVDAENGPEVAMCEFRRDGILYFYLRRRSPETLANAHFFSDWKAGTRENDAAQIQLAGHAEEVPAEVAPLPLATGDCKVASGLLNSPHAQHRTEGPARWP